MHDYFRQWNRDHGIKDNTFWAALGHHDEMVPPPVKAFIEAYQLDVTQYAHRIADSTEEPSIITLGKKLVMYHHYCMGSLDTDFLQVFFDRISGKDAMVNSYPLDSEFLMKATAAGYHSDVEWELLEFFTEPRRDYDDDYAPWTWSAPGGADVHTKVRFRAYDPQKHIPNKLHIDGKGLFIECVVMKDVAAGSQSLERWLVSKGYRDIVIDLSIFEVGG